MKKVIDGSLYNTRTAKLLGKWDNGQYGSLDFCAEDLYRTKSGKYFRHGQGGPRTPYAVPSQGGSLRSGEMIVPMSESDARGWAEYYLSGDDYLKAFPAVDEDLHTVAVSDRCYARLKALKDLTGKTYAQLVELAVDQYQS